MRTLYSIAAILAVCAAAHQTWATPASGEDSKPKQPKIVADSALVVDFHTGDVLYEKNPDKERPVASTQKLMTALVVVTSGNLENKVTVQKTDIQVSPVKLYMKPGDIYTRRQLLHALLMKSSNDVAQCLARDNAGSQLRFARRMNEQARRLGMRNSCFRNPHGLTVAGQHSSARDMSKLALAAYHNPTIRKIVGTPSMPFEFASGKTGTIHNTNRLLRTTDYCRGMKTGYTDASGRCLISTAGRDGRTVVAVVLGSTRGSIWNDSKALLDYALSPAMESEEVRAVVDARK